MRKERLKIIQFIVLFKIILGGILVGATFDFYRIVRWKLKIGRMATFLCDIVFSLLAAFIIIAFATDANNLEVRFYLFLAVIFGLLTYFCLFSKYIKEAVFFLTRLINDFYKQFKKIFLVFYKMVRNLLVGAMWLPYSVLRWFALLVYRIMEAVLHNIIYRTKGL